MRTPPSVVGTIAFCSFACCCSMGAADVLRQNDGTVLYGRIVQQSGSGIVFLERVSADNYIERRIQADAVGSLVQTIDERRLETLNPNQPGEYIRLAEELAAFRADPEAHTLSIRLYLIATQLSKDSAQRHCLKSLIELARTADERMRFCELAFLLDASATPKILSAASQSNAKSIPQREVAELIQAVQGARQGNGASASVLLAQERTQELLSQFSTIGSPGQLRELATVGQHSLEELQLLIKLEFALLRFSQGQVESISNRSWYGEASNGSQEPWFLPELSNVTEFDPAQNVFHNQQWRAQ